MPRPLPLCRRQNRVPRLFASRVLSSRSIGCKIRTGDQPSRPHGPLLLRLPLAGAEARSKKGKSACGVYLPDLEQPRPPDAPPGTVKLRLVKKAEGGSIWKHVL